MKGITITMCRRNLEAGYSAIFTYDEFGWRILELKQEYEWFWDINLMKSDKDRLSGGGLLF